MYKGTVNPGFQVAKPCWIPAQLFSHQEVSARMENKDGVPRGKRLSRFAGQDYTTTTVKGMTSVLWIGIVLMLRQIRKLLEKLNFLFILTSVPVYILYCIFLVSVIGVIIFNIFTF
jgi:hypothetical protein